MDSLQCWLDVHRAIILYEGGEAVEGLDFGRDGVQEWCCEDIHALHVRKTWPLSLP